MPNLFDYLTWRGDLSFEERDFNEIDNLIFSELTYVDYQSLFEELDARTMSIETAYYGYEAMRGIVEDDYPAMLLAACAQTERFKKIEVRDFKQTSDNEKQMQYASMTFVMPNNTIFVAYRGTDKTILGWREDFNFSYMDCTPAQLEATKYLNGILERYDGRIIVGGHSKGGNLAVYASAFCDRQDKISDVYSNDAPGFSKNVFDSEELQSILPKTHAIVPESSIIGIIMNTIQNKKVVKSKANIAEQHYAYTWQIERDHLITVDSQNAFSLKLDEILDRWVNSVDIEQRKNFVNCVFDSIEATGAVTVEDLMENKLASYNSLKKAAKQLQAEDKDEFIETLKVLGGVSKEVLITDNRVFSDKAYSLKKRFERIVMRKKSKQ